MHDSMHDPKSSVARLLAEVEQIVRESGDPSRTPGFDAATWLAAWLATPMPVLGGRTPAEHLETAEGVERVSRLLRAQQSGAYQ